MATIPIVQKPAPIQITKFLGLNSNEESETQLQLGEACDMRNIRIDEGYKLETIEGYELFDEEEAVFSENVFKLPIHIKDENKTIEMIVYSKSTEDENKIVLVEKQGKNKIEHIVDLSTLDGTLKEISDVFSYKDVPYMTLLFEDEDENEISYYVSLNYDNDNFIANKVIPYIPLVAIGTLPGGGGTDFEQINLLSPKRHQTFSPDGESTIFVVREKYLSSVDKVTVDGIEKEIGVDYTIDLASGKITFTTAPGEGSDTVDIYWTIADTHNESQVFSGDGTTKKFELKENKIFNINKVIVDKKEKLIGTDYTVNLIKGEIEFVTAPKQGTNNIEISWIAPSTNSNSQTFSPDGTEKKFTLDNKNLISVDKVIVSGEEKEEGVSVDLSKGTITFTNAPSAGTNTIEIQFSIANQDLKNESLVLNNKNHIFYGDGQDTYIFLYGNPDYPGRITYSDIGDYIARVDYFPANNFITIGNGTKQITGIVKQYDRLVISLFDSMYFAQYEELETTDTLGNNVALVTLRNYPLNDTIGCKQSELGSKTIMALLDNSPVVINDKGMYLINQTNVRTETNAVYISQRVQNWINDYTVERAYDLESKHEYWINGIREEVEDISMYEDDIVGTFDSLEEMEEYENPEIGDYALLQKRSDYCEITRDLYRYSNVGWTFMQNAYKYSNEWLIYNYDLNVFYKFAFYDIVKDIIEANGTLYIINSNGIFNFNKNLNIFGKGKYDYQEEGDKLGRPINSYWEMGYYNFGYEYKRKMLTRLWASVMPYPFSNIDVDIETDRGLGTQQYYIYMSMANFSNVRFDNFSFDTVYNPKPKRIKMKAKKFVYFKLKLSNSMFDTKFKILQLTMDWQLGGEAK